MLEYAPMLHVRMMLRPKLCWHNSLRPILYIRI